MHNVALVHILDSRQTLAEKLERLCLAESGMFILIVEQSAIFCQLHHHVNHLLFDKRIP